MMGGGGPKRSKRGKKELRRSGTEEVWPILLPMIPRYSLWSWARGRKVMSPSLSNPEEGLTKVKSVESQSPTNGMEGKLRERVPA
ncbi:hypothetical protein TNCV_5132851 [Trichonephila clavipes]|nr:hypothetical protein TNCV_5132851 [Trichonephila clavipes]